jgi:PRTRC genetic system protein B
MKANLNSEQSFNVALTGAILLYGQRSGVEYATLHDVIVSDERQQPRLGPGQSLTKGFIDEMLKGMGSELAAEVLPACVLSRTRAAITWWTPTRVRPMFFSDKAERPHLTGKLFPHPPLVFRATEGGLSVWALSGNQRPTEATPLHFAPYWNVSSNGSVCLGDAQRPQTLSVNTLASWEEGFFGSYFSHPNTNKHTTHPQGFDGLWAALKGKRIFPVDLLLPSTTTLAQALRSKRDG